MRKIQWPRGLQLYKYAIYIIQNYLTVAEVANIRCFYNRDMKHTHEAIKQPFFILLLHMANNNRVAAIIFLSQELLNVLIISGC